jgi:endo-1,4-beta-xylanase
MALRHLLVWSVPAFMACAPGPSEPARVQAPRPSETSLPSSFRWSSTGPLVVPVEDEQHSVHAVKDPSFVFFDGRFHLFATTASDQGGWSMLHASFERFEDAASARPYHFGDHPAFRGYHCAPQVFYFRPKKKWYLIFQSGQPQYSTTDDLTKPESWSAPRDFFDAVPSSVASDAGAGNWLDFWVICDEARCHLFFTNDAGSLFRSATDIAQFPRGFSQPVVALRGTREALYEASATYRVKGERRFLTLIEAMGPEGRRYFRSFVSETLDGEWSPLADSWENPFAGAKNVAFPSGVAWTEDVSHGELLRDGYDETLTIDPRNLRFLYQGVDPARRNVPYFELPYRLALLTPAK